MESVGGGGLRRAAGLVELTVMESLRRRGVATFLVSEALRQFLRQGITLVEAQVTENDIAARGLLQKLGFVQSAQGTVFRKQA